MPGKRKSAGKPTAKKSVTKKPIGKTAKKNIVSGKKTVKKKAVKKRSTARPARTDTQSVHKKETVIEPGPPPCIIPSVEEPARREEAVGVVTHYYSHLGVAVVQINKGSLSLGNTIHIAGHVTDVSQQVDSMEYEHKNITSASAGQSVGLRVNDHVREHDIVYLIK